MQYTITIPNGSADEFLKHLKSQCVPYGKRSYFIPDGELYASVRGTQFVLFTASRNTVSYLEGSVANAGTVTFAFSIPRSAKFIYLLLNCFMVFAFIASILQSGFSLFQILFPIVWITLACVMYFDLLRRSELNGNKLIQLIERIAHTIRQSQSTFHRCAKVSDTILPCTSRNKMAGH